MFDKERAKFGKSYVLDKPAEGQVARIADLNLGDLFVFAGSHEVVKLDEDGDDMNGGFLIARRIVTDEVVWDSSSYDEDYSGVYYPNHKCIDDSSPRVVRIKEKT